MFDSLIARLILVGVLCVGAFVSTLAIAQAGGSESADKPASAPQPLPTERPANVSELRSGAPIGALRPRKRRAPPAAPAKRAPAAPAARAPASPSPSRGGTSAPAPTPSPEPEPNPGTPFVDKG